MTNFQSGSLGQSKIDRTTSILNAVYKDVARPAESTASNPKDAMSGRRVFHQKFGYGKILSTDGDKLEIFFEKTGVKTVMKNFVTAA